MIVTWAWRLANQPAWQQRSQQLLKRLNVRGGEANISLSRCYLPERMPIALLVAVGKIERYQLANGMGRCSCRRCAKPPRMVDRTVIIAGQRAPDARILPALPVEYP
ncbi:hypothetical protein ACNKHM_06835 [Shigella sonnei]